MGGSEIVSKIFIHLDFLRRPYEFKVHHNKRNGNKNKLNIYLNII